MKTTFLFIAMLIFVNASKDAISPVQNVDPELLEISKDPSSEAVFATMAIRLNANGGFHQVLRLLNELVHDSKEQLHSITKVWRGVNARCLTTRIKLKGRQEYFETFLGQAKRHVEEASHRLTEVQSQIAGYKTSHQVYTGILKTIIARHARTKAGLKSRVAKTKEGIDALNHAHDAVKLWTPKGRALAQTHLEKVAQTFLEVHQYQLSSPTELLEKTDDTKVRQRILEWIAVVHRHLLSGNVIFEKSLRHVTSLGADLEKGLAKIIVNIEQSNKHLHEAVTFNQHMIKAGNAGVALFSKLVDNNSKLLKSNKAWCAVESSNYHKNRAQAVAAIKLFRQIRTYFFHNYRKLHSYIHTKYNH